MAGAYTEGLSVDVPCAESVYAHHTYVELMFGVLLCIWGFVCLAIRGGA